MQISLPFLSELPSATAFLTGLLTPALLISASGTFILATSNRLGRVVDRSRALMDRLEHLAENTSPELMDAKRKMLREQLDIQRQRAHMLQRCLVLLYVAAMSFVLTSALIGVLMIAGGRLSWLPVIPALAGAFSLFYASIVMIVEARKSVHVLEAESVFITELISVRAPR